MPTLRLILPDQLSKQNPVLENIESDDFILFYEPLDTFYEDGHHKQKIVFLISSMRQFIAKQNHKKIIHRKIHKKNVKFKDDLLKIALDKKIKRIIASKPSDFKTYKDLMFSCQTKNIELTILEDKNFISSSEDFTDWAEGKKTRIQEYYYRWLRKKYNIFMNEDSKPVGDKWNFDKENRNPIPDGVPVPHIDGFKPKPEVKAVIPLVKKFFPKHFGDIEPFWFGITREDAQKALALFIEKALPHFGEYQDAMLDGEAFLFHSVLSQYLNVGLLDPMEVCQQVELEYHQGHISLPCAEGFIRQIIGWREFIRGIYWHYMPDYQDFNAMNYAGKLPDLYWGEKTKMRCLSHTVAETRRHAYSHHIQRLMITGNFATLIGVRPELIHEWYLIVYIDAFEWVEMPNTMGMATFADGGIVGTKPYISGGNYINKMSNFCDKCHYKIKKKNGTDACPFNYLYWNYLITHHDKLKFNHRLRMPLATLARMSREKIAEIKRDSQRFLQKIENGNVI